MVDLGNRAEIYTKLQQGALTINHPDILLSGMSLALADPDNRVPIVLADLECNLEIVF